MIVPGVVRPALPFWRERVVDPSDAAAESGAAVSTLLAADLQDHLMTASNDLDRLQRLLADASTTLLQHFHGLAQQLEGGLVVDPVSLDCARQALSGAVVALQFQDMAAQLIAHTDKRLRSCADRLAHDALGDDED